MANTARSAKPTIEFALVEQMKAKGRYCNRCRQPECFHHKFVSYVCASCGADADPNTTDDFCFGCKEPICLECKKRYGHNAFNGTHRLPNGYMGNDGK